MAAFDPRDTGFPTPRRTAFPPPQRPAFPAPQQVPFPSRFPRPPYQEAAAEDQPPAGVFGIPGARFAQHTYIPNQYACHACKGIFPNDILSREKIMEIVGERVCKSCYLDHTMVLLEFRLEFLESSVDRAALREELVTTGHESNRTFERNSSITELGVTFAHLKNPSLSPDDQSCYERFLAHRLGVSQEDLLKASKRPHHPFGRTEKPASSRDAAVREHDRERERSPSTPSRDGDEQKFSALSTTFLQSKVPPTWDEHVKLMQTEGYAAMFFELATRYISDVHNLFPQAVESSYPSAYVRTVIGQQLRLYTDKKPTIRYADE